MTSIWRSECMKAWDSTAFYLSTTKQGGWYQNGILTFRCCRMQWPPIEEAWFQELLPYEEACALFSIWLGCDNQDPSSELQLGLKTYLRSTWISPTTLQLTDCHVWQWGPLPSRRLIPCKGQHWASQPLFAENLRNLRTKGTSSYFLLYSWCEEHFCVASCTKLMAINDELKMCLEEG